MTHSYCYARGRFRMHSATGRLESMEDSAEAEVEAAKADRQ